MGPKGRKMLGRLLVGLAVVALVAVGWYVFAPRSSDARDEPAPEAARTVSNGTFAGADALHDVRGTVALLRDDAGFLLRFEDYDATAGPDVYFYLTKDGAFDGDAVRVPTDSPTGQATLRGAFNVRVPAGVDASQHGVVVVWCDRFDVEFGRATLVA